MTDRYVVVLRRGTWETVWHAGSLAECEQRAAYYNTRYQTDEYRVEAYRD
nr:MAG TPA_asm: hypothetical protein [Caudoviricetes sp.]